MKRRFFLLNLFAFVPLSLGFLGISKMGLGFLSFRKKEKYRRIFVANINDIPLNSSKDMIDLEGKSFSLVRTGEKTVSALSSVCTHLGCSVHWESSQDIFFCPCHDGKFDAKGDVLSGPPPRSLDSYEVDIENDMVYIHMKEKES